MTNYTKSYQLDFAFHMPPRYFALEVFLDKVLEGGAQVYVVTMEEFLLSALEKEADNLESLKKKKQSLKKLFQSINSSFNIHVTQNASFTEHFTKQSC